MKEKISKFNNSFVKFCTMFVVILFGIIITMIGILSIGWTAKFRSLTWNVYIEEIDFFRDNILVNLVIASLMIFLIYFLEKKLRKVKINILLIISLLITGIFGLFWINYIKVPLRADSKMIYEVAMDFLNGDYNSLKLPGYMGFHPMQIGIVYFVELFYYIFKYNNPLIFQNFNVILILICNLLIYKITKMLFKEEKTQRILVIFLSMFFVLPMFAVLVYGNIIGLVFALMSILFLLKYLDNRKIRYVFLIPICMCLSIILKANYEIFLIAISILLFLDILKKFNIKNIIIILLVLILVKISNPLLYTLAEKQSNIKVDNGTPMIAYIAMGMAEQADRTPGWYNADFNVESVYVQNGFDVQKTKKECFDVITNRLLDFKKEPQMFVEYYAQKIGSTWLEPAFQTLWTSSPMEETSPDIEKYYKEQKIIPSLLSGKISKALIKYFDVLEIIIYFGNIYFIYYGVRKKKFEYKNVILIITFLGGFFFHILWETKSIYGLPFFILVIPSGAYGISKMLEVLENKFNKEKILEKEHS